MRTAHHCPTFWKIAQQRALEEAKYYAERKVAAGTGAENDHQGERPPVAEFIPNYRKRRHVADK